MISGLRMPCCKGCVSSYGRRNALRNRVSEAPRSHGRRYRPSYGDGWSDCPAAGSDGPGERRRHIWCIRCRIFSPITGTARDGGSADQGATPPIPQDEKDPSSRERRHTQRSGERSRSCPLRTGNRHKLKTRRMHWIASFGFFLPIPVRVAEI